jgi:hypothetical protein
MLLVPEQDEIRAPMNTKFGQHIRNVELHSALGDLQFDGDLLVGKIVKQQVKHLYFSRAQSRGPSGASAFATGAKNRVHEAGEQRSWHPEASLRYRSQRTRQLAASLRVTQQTLGSQVQKAKGAVSVKSFRHKQQVGLAPARPDCCD